MDGWFYLKIFWATLSLIILGTTSIILWRVRGILSWKRSLKSELEELVNMDSFGGTGVTVISEF